MDSPNKSCANCQSKNKTKLCHCGSIYICDVECWKSYCENNSEFKTRCQLAKYRLQINNLEAQQKRDAGKKRKTPRDKKTGQFANLPKGSQNNNNTKENPNKKEKTPEQKLKDQIASKASDKKRVALKYLRGYCKIVPENKLLVREVKKKGKAEIWLQSPGYNPLQSRLPSTTQVTAVNSGVAISDHENSARDEDRNEENSSRALGRNNTENSEDGPPNIENIRPEAVIQERTKINLKQFCGICNQGIGSITKRLKCNEANCQTHSSVHLACVGLYPSSAAERKIIQKSYFCSDHRPEADAVPNINQEEPEEGGQSTSSKGKTSRKRKASKDPSSDLSSPGATKISSTAARKRKSAASSKPVSKPKPGAPDGYLTPRSEMPSYSPSVNTPQVSEIAKEILPMLQQYSPSPTATESSSNGFVTLTPSTSWGVTGVNSINGYNFNENEFNQSTSFSSTTLGGSGLVHFTSY